jgi:site-specific recombinase XerC
VVDSSLVKFRLPRHRSAATFTLTNLLHLGDDPLFIALDNRSFGQSLSTRSIDRLLKRAAQNANVAKVLSPHRIRHSSITAFLDPTSSRLDRKKVILDKVDLKYQK